MIMKLYSSPWPFAVTRARVIAAAMEGLGGGYYAGSMLFSSEFWALMLYSPRVFMLGCAGLVQANCWTMPAVNLRECEG